MADRAKISVIIVTFNEAGRIRRCLSSVRWADEIVVVDQSSTDDTAAACREFTDKVYIVPNKGYCEPDRPTALSKTVNDWILYLDADEVVSDELRGEIESKLACPEFGGYYMARKNIYIGKWVKHSGWYPSRVLRLFKKDKVAFSEDIHTDVAPKCACGTMENDLLHYTYESIDEHVKKLVRYTSVTARQSFARGRRISPRNYFWKFFILPAVYFFNRYIWLRGYKDGFRGLLIGGFTFAGVFSANAKLWELQKQAAGSRPQRQGGTVHMAADILRNFLFLAAAKRTGRIYSDTGYSDLHALFLLARDGAGHGEIVEIGAFKGKSAVFMALGSQAGGRESVYSIDPHTEGSRPDFNKNVRMFKVENRVNTIEATSEDARKGFNRPVRLLFIDGCHEYDFVKKDILLWKDLVIQGGVMVFHDINWPTVARAVDELVRLSGEFIIEGETGCSLIVSKGFSANAYLLDEIRLFNRMKDIMRPWKGPKSVQK